MIDKGFYYPIRVQDDAINILKQMQNEALNLDGDFTASILMTGATNFVILAIGPNTNGIAVISIHEEQTGLENIVASKLMDFIETTPYKGKVLAHPHSFIPEDIIDIPIWTQIAIEKTNNDAYDFIKLLPEFSSQEKLPEIKYSDNQEIHTNIIHVRDISEKEMSHILRLLYNTIKKASGGRPIINNNIELFLKDLVNPIGLLPALLIHAAIKWSPIMLLESNKPGFRIKLKSTKQTGLIDYSKPEASQLGYRVMSIDADSIPLFAIPIGEIIQKSIKENNDGKEVCDISETFYIAALWLEYNNQSTILFDNYV